MKILKLKNKVVLDRLVNKVLEMEDFKNEIVLDDFKSELYKLVELEIENNKADAEIVKFDNELDNVELDVEITTDVNIDYKLNLDEITDLEDSNLDYGQIDLEDEEVEITAKTTIILSAKEIEENNLWNEDYDEIDNDEVFNYIDNKICVNEIEINNTRTNNTKIITILK